MRLTDEHWNALKERLRRSEFRSRFSLGLYERDYLDSRGMHTVRQHARDFLLQRLAPARPRKDGQQTPMKGHPAFIAQHATGICCRKCLRKWHGIPIGAPLTEVEIDYLIEVLMRWLKEQNPE